MERIVGVVRGGGGEGLVGRGGGGELLLEREGWDRGFQSRGECR